jgi:hypothetical protein
MSMVRYLCKEAGIAGLFLFFTAAFTPGCSQDIGSHRTEQQGQVQGTVFFVGVPCQPDRLSVPPCDGPYPNYEVIIFSRDGKTLAGKAISDHQGKYRLFLPAGSYITKSKENNALPSQFSQNHQAIIVEAGKTTHLDIHIDKGVR